MRNQDTVDLDEKSGAVSTISALRIPPRVAAPCKSVVDVAAWLPTQGRARTFAWTALGGALSLAVGLALGAWPGPYESIDSIASLLFLVPVVMCSAAAGSLAGMGAGILAFVSWDWFLLAPRQALFIRSSDDAVGLVMFFLVATVVGQFSAALRRNTTAALQREAELAAVLRVTRAATSTLDLSPLLELSFDQVQTVIDCTSVAVILSEGDRIRIAGYRGHQSIESVVGADWPMCEATVYPELVRRRRPIVVADLHEATAEAALFRRAEKIRIIGHQRERSWLWAPLLRGEEVIGALSLSHEHPRAFSEQQARFVQVIASQLGVAVENARLYETSRKMAAAEERGRLARELHDSVTQMLFASSLIADVLPQTWERDRDAANRSLEDLRQLTGSALAEMRNLLVELRPTALAEARLEDSLRQMAESVGARSNIPIQIDLDGEHRMPAEVQMSLYYIAREALTNAAKHSGAQGVRVTLRSWRQGIQMTISDDGRGFDLGETTPGHFGLSTMRERAEEVGATFRLRSAPGTGTVAEVQWQRTSAQ